MNTSCKTYLALLAVVGFGFPLLIGALAGSANAREWRVVAGTDMIAPGGFGDREFRQFLLGDIDDNGNVILGAQVTAGAGGQAYGIWHHNPDGLALLARELSFAPGVPGIRFWTMDITGGEGVVNDSNGNVLFKAVLRDGTGITDENRRGIWFGVPGSTLAPFIRIGTQAPGTPVGAQFGEYFDEVAMNENGQIVFGAFLKVGSGGVTDANRLGIWSNHSGTLQLVARDGSPAPGVPGRTFQASIGVTSSFSSLSLADNGDIGFVGRLDDARRGIWFGPPMDLRPIVLESAPAPAVEPGAVYARLSANDPYPDFAFSPNGTVAFSFRLMNGPGGVSGANEYALWAGRPGELGIVARKGAQAPGLADGVVFGFEGNAENPFRHIVLNDAGQIAFGGYIKGPGISLETNSGLWFGPASDLQLIAREGDSAPGTAEGVSFGDLWQVSPQVNASGQLIFNANVRGPGITSQSNNSMWAYDEQNGLQLLGYESQAVAVGSPFIREIASVGAFDGGRASTSGRTGLTDSGLVLASVRFQDGVRSVVTIDLNEPPGQDPELIPLIESGDIWKYRDDGANLGVAWREPGYDDASWSEGPSQLGYGDGDEATVVNCGPSFPGCTAGNYATTYFRRTIDLTELGIGDPRRIVGLTAHLVQDDAAAVYLNGVEVVRSASLPLNAAFNTFATQSSGDNEIWEFAVDPALLLPGRNVFAVEMHQAAANSSDISFDFVLTALVEPVPEPSSMALVTVLCGAILLRLVARRHRRLALPSRGG